MADEKGLGPGSLWRRWEPHVHAPGTIWNNQFKGPNAWEDYLTKLETAMPAIEAIAVTDYYCTATYQSVRSFKQKGRLKNVELLLPNVELRLDIATVEGNWANIHLLVSPEDEAHLAEIDRFLARLEFEAHGDKFTCSRTELIRLGRKAKPELSDDEAAFSHGASQFKVNLAQLRTEYRKSDWAKTNILIAVAGSKTDGTSGVREAGDATLREEIEKFAHIIFASSVAQREFWPTRDQRAGASRSVCRYEAMPARQRRSRQRNDGYAGGRSVFMGQGRAHVRCVAPSGHRPCTRLRGPCSTERGHSLTNHRRS